MPPSQPVWQAPMTHGKPGTRGPGGGHGFLGHPGEGQLGGGDRVTSFLSRLFDTCVCVCVCV